MLRVRSVQNLLCTPVMGQGKRSKSRQGKLSTDADLTLVKRRGAKRKSLRLQC